MVSCRLSLPCTWCRARVRPRISKGSLDSDRECVRRQSRQTHSAGSRLRKQVNTTPHGMVGHFAKKDPFG